jgi:hypothetical protein
MVTDMFEKGIASSSLDMNTLRTEVPHIYGQLNDINIAGHTTMNVVMTSKIIKDTERSNDDQILGNVPVLSFA